MVLTGSVRTHFIYQFIILTILYMAICYYGLLPDRKFVMFLISLPMFGYQLMILSCCTQLIPVPWWMDFGDFSGTATNLKEKSKTSHESCHLDQNEPKQLDRAKKSAKVYKSLSWRSNAKPSISVCTSQNCTSQSCTIPQDSDLELRKCYFPPSSKRMDDRNALKNLSRQCKTRNGDPRKFKDKETDILIETSDSSSTDFGMTEDSELTKSYSFPFRQKRSDRCLDSSVEELDYVPSMPYWEHLNYPVTNKLFKKRSVSSSRLSRTCPLYSSDTNRDFSRSVEISDPFSICSDKQTSSKTPVNFNNVKQRFINCFSRFKKDSIKVKCTKPETGKSEKLFKSIFRSRENIFFDYKEKQVPGVFSNLNVKQRSKYSL